MLIIRDAAEKDIEQAYKWYEDKKIGLGINFISEIESLIARIAKQPKLYAKVFKNIRRVLCKRFPYAVYYMKTQSNVIIIGVLHQKRSPMIWQNRN